MGKLKMSRVTWWLAVGMALASGCGGDDDGSGDPRCPVIVSEADCDTSLRPIVFVHGTFGSGDNIANVANLFGSNGYCQKRFVAIEYNSIPGIGESPDAKIDALIDQVLAETGQDQVDLMGHSQGTGHCVRYLNDSAHAAKVAHYVNLSGNTTPPAGVPTLSLSSDNDLGEAPHHATGDDVVAVTFDDEDHVDVAASDAAFVEIYKYLIGEDPQYTEVQCAEEEIELAGIAETFGDNVPQPMGRLDVYEIDAQDAPRTRGEPLMTITASATGVIAPVKLKRLTAYEFRAYDGDGALVGQMYFAPLKRSHYLARFLAPPSGLVASLTTDNVVISPNHSVLVGRYIRGSFRHDMGHSLKVNGTEVLTDDNAGRTATTVGLFMADQNENMQSDLGSAFTAPFVVGTDVFVDANTPAWIELEWNGETMRVPNWPADEGMISLMLP